MSRPLPKHRARDYETIFILNPESNTDVVDKVAGRCQDVIGRLEGKLLRAENWGRRRLAYPVRKNPKGIYIYLRYLGYQDLVHELERNLRMLDPVIKYLTVKVDEDVNPEARPVSEEDISFLPKYEEVEEVQAEAPEQGAEEPKAEEPKAEEPKAEEPKAEEPKAEEPKAEETADEDKE